MGALGSWFCNSWTRRLRKVVPAVELVRPESLESLEELEVPEVLAVAAALARATAALAVGLSMLRADDGSDEDIAETDIFPPWVQCERWLDSNVQPGAIGGQRSCG